MYRNEDSRPVGRLVIGQTPLLIKPSTNLNRPLGYVFGPVTIQLKDQTIIFNNIRSYQQIPNGTGVNFSIGSEQIYGILNGNILSVTSPTPDNSWILPKGNAIALYLVEVVSQTCSGSWPIGAIDCQCLGDSSYVCDYGNGVYQ